MKAPKVSKEVLDLISSGGQILLPFSIGDASINFNSRWELAEAIQKLIDKNNAT